MESFCIEPAQRHAKNNPGKFEVVTPSINAAFKSLHMTPLFDNF